MAEGGSIDQLCVLWLFCFVCTAMNRLFFMAGSAPAHRIMPPRFASTLFPGALLYVCMYVCGSCWGSGGRYVMMDLLFWLVAHLRLRKGGGGREGGRFDISVIVGCMVCGIGQGGAV